MNQSPKPSHLSLREAVGERVASVGPDVASKVIEHFADIEIGRRSEAIVKAMDTLDSLEREKQKTARPDIVSYHADKTVAAEAYSKEKVEAIEKLDKKIDRFKTAIDKSLNGDFGDLYNLNKGGGEQGEKS